MTDAVVIALGIAAAIRLAFLWSLYGWQRDLRDDRDDLW